MPGTLSIQATDLKKRFGSFWAVDGLTFEVRLRLDRAHIEPTVLHSGRDSTRSRLGWDTFLQTRPSTADRGDIRYELHPA